MVAPYLVTPAPEVANPFGEYLPATVQIVDYEPANASRSVGMAKMCTPASDELTAELDGATEWLGLAPDEILIAALARTIARTLGDGVVPIDVAGDRRGLLDAVPVVCATTERASATEVLGGVHRALAVATDRGAHRPSIVYFNHIGDVLEDAAPVRETPPGLGHALEVRVYRAGGAVHVDWWYDTSRFEDYTVEELTEQFPLALYEMTSDALPPI